MTFAGRFSDGLSAASRSVAVRLGEQLEIVGSDGSLADQWGYGRLQSAAPVHWRDEEVLLRALDRPGTLFVSSPAFAAALLKKAPKLSARAHRWRYAIPGLTIVVILAIAVGVFWVLGVNLSQATARLIPLPVRASIGERAMASFVAGHNRCESVAGVSALNDLVATLSKASGTGITYDVRVVDWDVVNAFALPGNKIVILRGLIDKAKSADEVAGVLAHEMGHGIELHPEAGIVRSLGLSALIEFLVGGQQDTLKQAGVMLLLLRYSREAEAQADAHALEILRKAGISPKPLAVFFKRMAGLSGAHGNPATNILSDHPPTPERARLAEAAATYESHPALTFEKWQALRGICGGPSDEPQAGPPSQPPAQTGGTTSRASHDHRGS
jgi:Zn-dependent protease with chaperone function